MSKTKKKRRRRSIGTWLILVFKRPIVKLENGEIMFVKKYIKKFAVR